ncbi:MAG: hypothetical protein JWQ09_3334 [Segetibacter sp.]|nr:hypothetical protein [Segetibacter sp.]
MKHAYFFTIAIKQFILTGFILLAQLALFAQEKNNVALTARSLPALS